jgi:ribulose-5-phosphate 4-epimerase/fuculose-1-phosphate aldolase
MPPIGADLDVRQELACALGILARSGFTENIAGHITVRAADTGDTAYTADTRDTRDTADTGDTEDLWINPWGLWWEEITAADICRVSPEGEVRQGKWDVTPAFHIHTELHRRRPDARVVVHNHPYHATVLAALGVLPDFVHQTGSMFDGDMVFVDEYTGEVASSELGADLAERIGGHSVVLLANHGVIVTGPSVQEATYRAATLERQCRLMYDVLVSGRDHTLVAPALRRSMKASLLERGTDFFWNGAVRALLRDRPEVLDR